MNVRELIEILSSFPKDAEVRIASQPSWPFENAVDDVVLVGDGVETITREQFDELSEIEQQAAVDNEEAGRLVFINDGDEAPQPVVYIGEGNQLGYLSTPASSALGW